MGEKADVCKTTSVKYDTPKTSVTYLLPEYGLAWREADLTLESEINVQWESGDAEGGTISSSQRRYQKARRVNGWWEAMKRSAEMGGERGVERRV
jgi:hypothetical protein